MTDESLNQARRYIDSLARGIDPGDIPVLNGFSEQVKQIKDAFHDGFAKAGPDGGKDAIERAFESLTRHDSKYELLRPASMAKKSGKATPIPGAWQPLPESARLPEGMGKGACQWLDRYIAFSKRMSPSGYEGFHEAVGLWLLSTIAARRIGLPLGSSVQYSMLYICLCARSGIFAKSETTSVGTKTLKQAGMGYLLMGNNHTPQSFIKTMTGVVPSNYAAVQGHDRAVIERSIAFSGQRSWFLDEFEQFISGMKKKSGHMHEFSGMMRELDRGEDEYTLTTIGRGEDKVHKPYLSLLANVTPSDLRTAAGKGAEEWGNGFWARVAVVGPNADTPLTKGRMPNERFQAPNDVLEPLVRWNERLGVPEVLIDDDPDNPGKFRVARGSFPDNECHFGPGTYDAFYNYFFALQDMVHSSSNMDLDGNYVRFAAKALRIAMLFASLENNGIIEMKHWAAAQEICERWRKNLHAVVNAINEPSQTINETIEEKITERIESFYEKHGHLPTMRELRQRIRGADSKELVKIIEGMVRSGILDEVIVEGRKTKWYRAARDEKEKEEA
jgi:Protein of unknown function (DUF3987)